jgi:epoxyqueuosine reductase
VCPFNRTAPPSAEKTAPFAPHPRWSGIGLDDLVGLDESGWNEAALGTPIHRAGRAGMARNAVVVAANRLRRDPEDAAASRAIAKGREHDDAMVRDLAAESALSDTGKR